MYFLDNILSLKTKNLRRDLLNHPLWQRIKDGTLPTKGLQTFALQDFWLIKQARRIDGLAIAKTSDPHLQKLLINRLGAKHKYQGTIFDFGYGVGLSKKDFESVEPIPGCMALTTFFYWMIDYSTDFEKAAAIFASIGVFSDICLQVYKPLMRHYKLSEKQAGFFSGHKFSEGNVDPVSEYIEKNLKTGEEKKKVDHAVMLSHEFEKMFYDTVLASSI